MSDATGKPAGWDYLFQSGHFPPRYQTLAAPNESVVAWADTLPSGARILDLGCGVGRHTLYLGGRGFRMAGLDISPIGVQTTREACESRGLAFDGRTGDITAIPWEDQAFDAVLSTSTICHKRRADLMTTIGEVRRVLKPGGLFLADFPHKDTASYQRVRAQAAAGTISEVEPDTFVDESAEPDRLDDAFLPHHYCDEAEVRDLLRDFELVRLWAEFMGSSEGSLPQRGYWVAIARKRG